MSKPISKDWVEAYFENGVDVANRRIFLWGDIDEDTISDVVKGIYLMESKDGQKAIELYVSSEGGDVIEMFGLYDVLNTIRCPIHTVAIGKCMSAAPLLVAAGKVGYRYSTPHCSFMVHQDEVEANGKLASAEEDMKFLKRQSDRWAELMAKHTKKSKRFWLDLCKRNCDVFFSADEAIEYGLVDALWSEK